MDDISVVIATFNEEKNIKRCLESIKEITRNIIVIDGQSQDKTVDIARKYTKNIYVIKNQKMFHSNKQVGIDKVKTLWTLQLDADEVVTEGLIKEIQYACRKDNNFSGYFIPRKNNFLGRFMKKGGLYPDYVLRLFKTKKGRFPQKSVHEQIEVEGETGYLENPLLHYSYETVNDYFIKANRYTWLTADELKGKGVGITPLNTIKYCIVIPLGTFVSIFFRHLGFVDGFYGFVWAFFSSTHSFLAYAKLIKTGNT